MEDDKLIGIDMWVNRHEAGDGGGQGGAAPTGFSSGIPQAGGVAERAERADVADRANEAEHANTADESNHAKTADEAENAKTATEADHAKSADEASHAKTADDINLESKTLSHFLRKDIQDTAVEVLTFLKGIIAKAVSYFKGIVNDGDITNTGTITTKNLNVTGKATFFELMIQITKAAGGMTVYSPGAFHIDAVEDEGDYFACFQRAEKDGVKLRQMCDVDDQLMCARFNVDGNGNKFYWMRVSYISSNTVQHVVDGKLVDCLEVRLDKSPKADNCQGVPEVGDALAVFGNRTKEDRQSVIVISAYNSFDIDLRAPYIAQYEHVNDFNLESKKTTWLSKGENHLTGSFTVVSGGKKVSLKDFVTKISQATFKVEADRITARIDGVENETTKKYSELQSTVNSISSTVARKSDLENVRTEIKQTAEEINLSVENGTRPNLLWGSDLNLDGVDTTDKAAIQKHLGVGMGEIKVDDAEYFKYLKGGGVAGADAIRIKNAYKREGWAKWTNISWHDVTLKPNTEYTISVWVKFKSYGKKGRMYVDCNSDDGRWNFGGYRHSEHNYSREDIDEWTRVKYVFYSGESRKIKDLFFACIADEEEGAQCEIWLCRPKLEEGNTATPWCAYDVTADAVEQITSIFIKDNKIQLNARNTEVSGDLSVGSLKTTPKVTGDPFIEAHDGEFNIFTFERKKGIELSVDDSGMPHLIFYDKAGNPAYDLGWTGMKQLIDANVQEYWSADFLMREDSYTDATRISNITRDKCKEYYTYHAAYNRTTGAYGSNKEYNDVTFVEKNFNKQRIADGWYYPVNNGSLARVANESAYLYGTRKYQYSNGKMTGYENVYIEKDPVTGAWRFSDYKGGRGSNHSVDQHSQP